MAVDGRAEESAGVIAAAVVSAFRGQEHILAAASVDRHAGALLACVGHDVLGEQVGQEAARSTGACAAQLVPR